MFQPEISSSGRYNRLWLQTDTLKGCVLSSKLLKDKQLFIITEKLRCHRRTSLGTVLKTNKEVYSATHILLFTLVTCYDMSFFQNYSRLSLSRTRLSGITAYIEVKIWSLFYYRDLPTGNKILWKRGERSNFSSFPQFFQYLSNLGVKLHIHSVKGGCLIIFLSSANLICRSTDISKCFIVSSGVRDNESRLYMYHLFCKVDATLYVFI